MARPKKDGLDYFPFDVDFFEDEKIVAIAGEFGLKGEITAVKLLCAVYRNGYFIEWSDMLKMKMIRSLPGISPELFDQILNRLVRWGFFDASLFDTVKVLTSRGIQRRYFEAVRRRKDKDDFPYLLVNVCNNPVNVGNNPVNDCNNPQSKGKERKGKNIIQKKNKETNTREEAGKTFEEKCLMTFQYFNDMVQYYHSAIRPVKILTDERRRKIENVVRRYDAKQICTAIRNAMCSDYLNGRTPRRKLPADFDWIFEEKNFTKIFEGSV